ncbi:PQQ-binding-like beta-propeller repeat protein [Streptomyces sp. HC44]|uniref:PQQ-binding-like beta-propeller repeat protein n=1 Tax=Streptomyces scabichelini TaxID=2711217 RepID=A0A6G4VAN9_9ACTN|nr:PQQ-binding-like beta-propeller repeat protein [Streptomyces scabichelini]NGO10873.1 PQQ-binding-like beta-propeller repeat protein [Streptomyces scabichelini]
MSQPPPPPPNQPPQEGGQGAPQDPPPGGFGAPQSPPPGGFGAPQSPPPGGFGAPTPPQGTPPNPAYGYPQAPGTPPPTAPPQPYGYPQAPQPPQTQPPGQPGYGYPGQQPQYGYPQPSTMPLQPQAPGGGRKFNAQLLIIVAAVLAIGLIVGGGVWYSSSTGSDEKKNDASGSSGGTGGQDDKGEDAPGGGGSEKVPSNTTAKVLFQVPAAEVPKDDVWSVAGSWLTDKVYAKAGVNEVIGYNPDTGAKSWTMPLTGQTCAGSPEVTKDGVAVVVAEEAKRTKTNKYPKCTKVTAFNLNTGEKLWTESVTSGGSENAAFKEASITGTTVALGAGLDGGAGLDLTTGKILWQPKVEACEDIGYRGGEQLVAVRKCGEYGAEKYEVQLLNPKDGSVKWTYKLPTGIDNAKVISSKPVVFGVDSDSDDPTLTGTSDIFSLDEGGKLRIKIAMPDDTYGHDCGVGNVHDCKGITVGNDKLYVPTKQHDGTEEFKQTNEIISFSLATGKTTGDRADAGDGYELFPIRMDGGNIIAYKQGPYDKGSQVVSIDGGSFKQTKLLETPASEDVRNAISSMVPKSSEMLYTSGRLFMAEDLISKPSSSLDRENYSAIGFGAQ